MGFEHGTAQVDVLKGRTSGQGLWIHGRAVLLQQRVGCDGGLRDHISLILQQAAPDVGSRARVRGGRGFTTVLGDLRLRLDAGCEVGFCGGCGPLFLLDGILVVGRVVLSHWEGGGVVDADG